MTAGNKFGFKIENSGSSDKIVAIMTGNLKTKGFDITQNTEEPFEIELTGHNHNPAALIAHGIYIDAVLDDGTIGTDLVATSKNLQNKIFHFREYVKTNPQILEELTIEASHKDVFSENLFLRKDSPLTGTDVKEIALSDYLNLMQKTETKIVIPFNETAAIPLSDTTFMWFNVPAGRTVNFYMKLRPGRV